MAALDLPGSALGAFVAGTKVKGVGGGAPGKLAAGSAFERG